MGNDLIDKQSTEVQPGTKKIVTQDITAETRYLGITAAYRNIDSANWRSVIELPANKKQYTASVNLESQSLATKLQ